MKPIFFIPILYSSYPLQMGHHHPFVLNYPICSFINMITLICPLIQLTFPYSNNHSSGLLNSS